MLEPRAVADTTMAIPEVVAPSAAGLALLPAGQSSGRFEITTLADFKLAWLPPVVARWLPHLMVIVVVVAMTVTTPLWRSQAAQPITGSATAVATDAVGTPSPFAGETLPIGEPDTGRRLLSVASVKRSPLEDDYLTTISQPITVIPQRVSLYTVQSGDTLAQLAQRFNVDIPSLQWANGLNQSEISLRPGQELRIPPIQGVLHTVRQSDTLASIAASYKVDPQAIVGYKPNQVKESIDLIAGRTIMVPGGTMPARTDVIMHTVVEGDTINSLAERYAITAETIISANSLDDPGRLSIGQQLAILPVAGIGLIAEPGDSVAALAVRYRVDESAIRGFAANGLGSGGEVVPGQALVIPGGRQPVRPQPAPEPDGGAGPEPVQAAARSATTNTAAARPAAAQAAPPPRPTPAPAPPPPPRPVAGPTGRMAWPTTGTITTYFSSWHNGLDVANGFGTSIGAADGGVVTYAGWRSDGLGIAVFIDHGGGLQTWYGHFSRVVVVPGQTVAKGQLLGYMGSTGRSTGPHLHFMVLQNNSYRNPLNYLP